MQVEEIAEILGISITEARQLASLRMAAGKKAA
jgi:DNA-directed RNA polymerase specialized sigma24 family protein